MDPGIAYEIANQLGVQAYTLDHCVVTVPSSNDDAQEQNALFWRTLLRSINQTSSFLVCRFVYHPKPMLVQQRLSYPRLRILFGLETCVESIEPQKQRIGFIKAPIFNGLYNDNACSVYSYNEEEIERVRKRFSRCFDISIHQDASKRFFHTSFQIPYANLRSIDFNLSYGEPLVM